MSEKIYYKVAQTSGRGQCQKKARANQNSRSRAGSTVSEMLRGAGRSPVATKDRHRRRPHVGGLALFGPYQPSMPARRELPLRAQQFFISGHLRSFIDAVYGVETGRTSLRASSQLKEPGSRGSPKTVAGPATIAKAKLQCRQWAP